MSEAKDWAGELISGQTGTGRILVSLDLNPIIFCTKDITISIDKYRERKNDLVS